MQAVKTKDKNEKPNPKRWNGTLARSNGGDFYDLIGMHQEPGFVFAFRVCNCAPEQFEAYINKRRVSSADAYENGHLLLNEGPQKLIDVFKRKYRKERKPRPQTVAYGFRFCDDPNSGAYIDNYGSSGDLQSRLTAYKRTKAHFTEMGWRYFESQTATLGVGYKVDSVKEEYRELDSSGPFRLVFRQEGGLFKEDRR